MIREIICKAHSAEELEAQLDRLQERSDNTGETFRVKLRFKLPANGPCVCGSGKKWKRCCLREESDVKITIWPHGTEPPWEKAKRRRLSPAKKLTTLAILGMMLNEGSGA